MNGKFMPCTHTKAKIVRYSNFKHVTEGSRIVVVAECSCGHAYGGRMDGSPPGWVKDAIHSYEAENVLLNS